jgi:Ca2+-binding RTX toxin-like protein
MQRMVALLCGGDDAISVGGRVMISARIDGGMGNDSIVDGGGPSVLLGGLGNDSVTGGRGRNVIIGGVGADRLVGGAGSDLLIGGRTSFDNDDAALMAILAEWTSSRSFTERVANLQDGLGPILYGTGIKLKKGQTVFDDADVDSLVGAADLDWFLYDATRDNARDEK